MFKFRFTKLAAASSSKEKAPPLRKLAPPPKIAPIKASAKNRNLAMQMANKPSVQAALKIKNVISMRNFQIIYNFNLKLF